MRLLSIVKERLRNKDYFSFKPFMSLRVSFVCGGGSLLRTMIKLYTGKSIKRNGKISNCYITPKERTRQNKTQKGVNLFRCPEVLLTSRISSFRFCVIWSFEISRTRWFIRQFYFRLLRFPSIGMLNSVLLPNLSLILYTQQEGNPLPNSQWPLNPGRLLVWFPWYTSCQYSPSSLMIRWEGGGGGEQDRGVSSTRVYTTEGHGRSVLEQYTRLIWKTGRKNENSIPEG